MMSLADLNYLDWTPGPNPIGWDVTPNLTHDEHSKKLEEFDAWQEDIAARIRPGCVLRMANGDFVLIGNATCAGWDQGQAYESRDSDSSESWCTEDITGVAYPFEDASLEIAPESYQEPGDDFYDEMDGDHQSALASAGLGTDEDYGCYDSGDNDY